MTWLLIMDKINKTLNVLIVEDHPDILDSLRTFLRSFPNVQVACASSFLPATALIAASDRLDLLLCDVFLRGEMSGIDVAEVAVTTHPDIAVVMLSAEPPETIEGLTERYSFAKKPFGGEEITHHIDTAFLKLRGRNQNRPAEG
jgi:DNA-binding NtrC family response regulator